jgi:hypothetical protein
VSSFFSLPILIPIKQEKRKMQQRKKHTKIQEVLLIEPFFFYYYYQGKIALILDLLVKYVSDQDGKIKILFNV